MKSVFIALTILLTLAPLATHAQTVFMGPNGEPLGSAYNLSPRQNPCQDDIIVVVPQRRNRVMNDFYEAQERTQRLFENHRRQQEYYEQRRNRRN